MAPNEFTKIVYNVLTNCFGLKVFQALWWGESHLNVSSNLIFDPGFSDPAL